MTALPAIHSGSLDSTWIQYLLINGLGEDQKPLSSISFKLVPLDQLALNANFLKS